MADRTTYATLEFDKRHLKGLTSADTQAQGIATADLLAAEAKTLTRINEWVISVAGAVRGKQFVDEWMDDANTVDAQIVNLADLIASYYAWEWWERRNYREAPQGEAPIARQSDRIQDEALKLARSIERSGKTLKSDRTVRRWKYGPLEQGPIVGGALVRGSMFSDRGYYTDPYNGTRRLPHRHPLTDAT